MVWDPSDEMRIGDEWAAAGLPSPVAGDRALVLVVKGSERHPEWFVNGLSQAHPTQVLAPT